MAQETFVKADTVTVAGQFKSDLGNISTDGVLGNLTVANLQAASQTGGMSATVTLTTGGTVTSATRLTRVTAGSAVTGIVVATGTAAGQELTIIHTGAAASSITFSTAGSAAGSSNVATDFVISGLTCSKYVWDVTSALWYPVVF